MKILIADDEKDIVDLLTIYLQNEGYEIIKAHDGQSALELIEGDSTINMALLDIMMPKLDGLTLLANLRNSRPNLPVILISAKSEDNDKIQGLFSGADDYIAKPFNPLEVVARIRAIIRRQNAASITEREDIIRAGSLEINKESHQVTSSDGKNINLTASEFGILLLLASHPNKVFSIEDIFENVWNRDSNVSAKTVMVHVSHLRDKIEKATNGEKIIHTVWGVGYKIEG